MDSSATSETGKRPRRTSRTWIALAILLGSGALVAGWFLSRRTELPAGISRAEYDEAVGRFVDVRHRQPTRYEMLMLLGETAVADERLDDAIHCFQAVPTDVERFGLSARLQEGQILLRLNRAMDAERSFREFLDNAETDVSVPRDHLITAYNWLNYILSVELRFEDRKRWLARLHRSGQADTFDSKQYYFPTLLIWHSSRGQYRIEEFLAEDPENVMLQTAHARYLTTDGKLDRARELLEALHQKNPGNLDVVAALLECLYESALTDPFASIAESLPEYRESEPWLLTRMRGECALGQQRWSDAIDFFQKTLSKDPADPASHMGLAQAYAGLNDVESREAILKRSRTLSEIRVGLVAVTEQDAEASRQLAETCAAIGLEEAAETFLNHAERIAQPNRRRTPFEAIPL